MKAYTDVLINKVEGGHKWWRPDPDMPLMHYEAKHVSDNIYIMWMETRAMRRRCAYPCVIVEDGDVMVFKPSKSIGAGAENADQTAQERRQTQEKGTLISEVQYL